MGRTGREHRVVVCIGTRPEAIKLFPVVKALEERHAGAIEYEVVLTGQHSGMLKPTLEALGMAHDHDFGIMTEGQPPAQTLAKATGAMSAFLEANEADLVVVQGDTTTALGCAQAAFLRGVDVAHVEAGLRTRNLAEPYPEEANRRMIACIASLNFAPTEKAARNLLEESVPPESIVITGNTVVDSLLYVQRELLPRLDLEARFPWLASGMRLVLVTGHRREALPHGLEGVLQATIQVLEKVQDAQAVFLAHLNPLVQRVLDTLHVPERLSERFHVLPPLDYPSFVGLLSRAHVAVTDSGGIQEEAPYLGVPVLCTRNVTERTEALDAGVMRLVGTNPASVREALYELLASKEAHARMARRLSLYGSGDAGVRIADAIVSYLERRIR